MTVRQHLDDDGDYMSRERRGFVETAMSSISPRRSGIPDVGMWIRPEDGLRHGPRIKVSNIRGKARYDNADCFSVRIPTNDDTEPSIMAGKCQLSKSELDLVFEFVKANWGLLVLIWESQIYPDDAEFTRAKGKGSRKPNTHPSST